MVFENLTSGQIIQVIVRWLVVSGIFMLFLVLGVVAWAVQPLRLGMFILFEVLLFFMIISKNFSGEWGITGLTVLFLFALYFIQKAFFQWKQFSDLYKVARYVIPKFEAEHFKPVNFSKVRTEYFKGYYLVEYFGDGLTVAWHKDLGVVARRNADLEQFKKYFVPEQVAEPRPVSGEAETEVSGGGEVDKD